MQGMTGMAAVVGNAMKGCVAYAVRRLEELKNGGRARRMRVVESLALGGRRQLLLIVCDEQEYLVGAGAESVATIVLRQPGGVPAGSARSTGVPADAAQGRISQSGGVHAGGAARGPMVRNWPPRGPWLVAPGVHGAAENRIREAELGKGRHLWQ